MTYTYEGNALRAKDELNFRAVRERQMRVMEFERETRNKREDANLFVKNLPREFTNRDLYFAFKLFGEVLSSKVCSSARGESKGFGFVQFAEAGAAERAMREVGLEIIRMM